MTSFVYIDGVPTTHTLELRNPSLGNQVSLDLGLTVLRAIDGTAYTYVSTPVKRRFSVNFTWANRPKILEAIEFFKLSAGQQLTYIDYNGESWLGYILTPVPEFTHQARRNNVFNLEFEGTLVG